MKRKSVDELVGNEVLERHILTSSGAELMTVGTVVRKEYINRLKELNYKYVYVRDDEEETSILQSEYLIRQETRKNCIDVMKKILNKHIFRNGQEIEKICKLAEEIITEIVNTEQMGRELENLRKNGNDLYTHSINVCALSCVVALKMGIEVIRVRELAKGALLHDIGLKYCESNYTNIYEEELSESERLLYTKHTIEGYEIVVGVEQVSEIVKNIILLHHEKNDGSGYPCQYKESDLETEVKIVSICDTFDSMITGIGAKQSKVYEALEFLKVHTKDYFDKDIVNVFVELVARYPIGTEVVTNEGDVGLVIGQNRENPERPKIKLIRDKNGLKIKEDRILDLLQLLTVFVVDTYE